MKHQKIAILPKLYDYHGDLNQKWYVFYSIRDPRSDKMITYKHYKGLAKCKTKKARYDEAHKIMAHYTELIKTGWNPAVYDNQNIYSDSLQYKHAAKIFQQKRASNRTFNFFANKFLQSASGLAPATISTYTSKIRVFDQWLRAKGYADLDITAITNDVLIGFFTYLNQERESSQNTYRKFQNLLREIFDDLIEQGIINIQPVQRLPKNRRVVSKAPGIIAEQDLQAVKQYIKANDPQLYLFICFEYYCFMRPGEVRMMKVEWIDWGKQLIRVPANVNKTRGIKTPIISNEFMRELREDFHLHTYPRDHYVIGNQDHKPGKMHIGKNTMRLRFNKIRKRLNLPESYMLYSFKHTGNSAAVDAGISAYERMMQNGHTSIRTTEIYTKNKIGFQSEDIRQNFPKL
jgi:integrase